MASEQEETGKRFRLPQKWKSYLVMALIITGVFFIFFWGAIFGVDTHQLT